MNRSLASIVVSLVLAGCSGAEKREICGDGIDNDGNGLTDCQDRDCTGQPQCAPPDYGSCSRCGQMCQQQSSCIGVSYQNDRPIPLCTDGICQATEKFIQPRVEVNTRMYWSGLAVVPRSASTRFIKKTAIDGSAVTCARVAQVAADRMAPGAIEASNQFQVQGLDVTRVTNPELGQGITLALVNTQTGSDYLIWLELWGGFPDSTTSLPTGRRLGWGCYEDANTTRALTLSDNCPSATNDAGTCRIFQLVMPGPEMP
jgi:hypothetical protein